MGQGREDGSTRGLIVRLRQEWRFKALNKAISEHREQGTGQERNIHMEGKR